MGAQVRAELELFALQKGPAKPTPPPTNDRYLAVMAGRQARAKDGEEWRKTLEDKEKKVSRFG